jgi:hypothetical protein
MQIGAQLRMYSVRCTIGNMLGMPVFYTRGSASLVPSCPRRQANTTARLPQVSRAFKMTSALSGCGPFHHGSVVTVSAQTFCAGTSHHKTPTRRRQLLGSLLGGLVSTAWLPHGSVSYASELEENVTETIYNGDGFYLSLPIDWEQDTIPSSSAGRLPG